MNTVAETPAQQYARLSHEFGTLRHIHPDERTAEQRARLTALNAELSAILAVPPDGYELPRIAADLMAHAQAHGWLAGAQWTEPDWEGQPFVKVEVGRRLTGLERDQHRSDRWQYQLTWHSRGCAPGKVKLFGSGLACTPDNPSWHDAPSVKAIRAVIEAHADPSFPRSEPAPPIVAGDLYAQVLEAAEGRCQCQGACGKKHQTAERKPGRCEHVNGVYVKGSGRLKLLAIPRDPSLAWHEAAALPARRLIAFCRPCADGVKRIVNRAVKAQPPQCDGLFEADSHKAPVDGDVT